MRDNINLEYETLQKLVKLASTPETFVKTMCEDENIEFFKPAKNYLAYMDLFKTQDTIVLSKRQDGKTISMLAYALWYSLFNSDKNTSICGKRQTDVKMMMDTINLLFEHLPDYIKTNVEYQYKGGTIRINRNKIIGGVISDTVSYFHGMTIDLVILDDFSYWDLNQSEHFLKAYYPSLCSREKSRILINGTASTKDSTFYKLFYGDNNFFKINRCLNFNPSKPLISALIHDFGEDFVKREYCGEFL